MLLKVIPLVFVCARLCSGVVYDRYTGKVASDEQLDKYEKLGVTSTCTKDIQPCDATERRRVDGSCNSLDHPMRGTFFEPLRRVLEAHYSNGSDSRLSKAGTALKPPRDIRNHLLCEGKSTSAEFTQAVPGYGIFAFGDIGSVHDIKFFLQNVTNCCTAEGMDDPQCTPNIIPEDDPVHRFSGIRCMNLTKPLTYSDFGCTDDTEPSPIEEATGVYDLSPIYCAADKNDSVIRSFVKGQLTTDVDENGVVWPPNGDGFCTANQPGETRCFGNYPNTLLSVMLLAIWYMRQHNYFATKLAEVNPCWDDETLYQTARDINIAWHQQVYYSEWLATIIGREQLIKDGVISNCSKHRDIYDNSTYPEVSLEFTFILRWFHLLQEGSANVYDIDGTYLREYPYANFTMRPGYLGIDNNIKYFSQHMFRQPCRKLHSGVDPDIAENGLPYIQRAVDITASDLHKSRLLGFAPYIDYVNYCTGHNITSFDDLELHMDGEKVKLLKDVYADVWDIDLLAGTWVENTSEGGSISATASCIMIEHLKKAIQSDRHWYERADRPYALTEDQLRSIRNASLAGLMCNAGDNITVIQARAFEVISDENPLMDCSEIPNIDFSYWADSSCTSSDSSSDTSSTTDASNTGDDSTTSYETTSDTSSSSDASASSASSTSSDASSASSDPTSTTTTTD